jgi:DNA replication protein DnaC
VRIVNERRAQQPPRSERASPVPRISKSLKEVEDRLLASGKPLTPEQEAEQKTKTEERKRQKVKNRLQWRLDRFLGDRGARYRECSLDNFETSTAKQKELLSNLREYAANMATQAIAGNGIVLFGPKGTGKDHLLVAMARIAIETYGYIVGWQNGFDLFAELRDGISLNLPEAETIDRLVSPKILVLSDPLPPVGALTQFQASTLLRIIDRRYSACQPTWCSLNVTSGGEADERMGSALVDRLRHGALSYFCDWPSFRTEATR